MLSPHFAPPPTAKKRKAATLASHAVPQRRLGCSCDGTKAEGPPVGSGHRRHLTKSGSGDNPRVFRMFRPGTVTGRAGPQPGGFWGAATTLGRRRRVSVAPAPQGHLDHGTSPRAPRCPAATRGDRPQQPGGSGPDGTFPKLPHAPLRVGALRAAHSTPKAGVHPSLKPARFPRPPQPPNPCQGTKPPLLEHPSPAEPLQRPLLGREPPLGATPAPLSPRAPHGETFRSLPPRTPRPRAPVRPPPPGPAPTVRGAREGGSEEVDVTGERAPFLRSGPLKTPLMPR